MDDDTLQAKITRPLDALDVDQATKDKVARLVRPASGRLAWVALLQRHPLPWHIHDKGDAMKAQLMDAKGHAIGRLTVGVQDNPVVVMEFLLDALKEVTEGEPDAVSRSEYLVPGSTGSDQVPGEGHKPIGGAHPSVSRVQMDGRQRSRH